MARNLRQSLLKFSLVCLIASPFAASAQALEPIAANDNRKPGGEIRDGVLTLRLELREGNWHPFREDGEAIPVYAFAEQGKPLQVPAPLVRVPQGTIIDASIHNGLKVPATLHGFHRRPGNDNDAVVVPPGETQTIRFEAGAPGTYLYRATTPDGKVGNNRVKDTMLGGAFVIDEPGAPANDRVFVFERWTGATRTAINGKSWPNTERITLKAGETVHWRMVNASDLSHPMHLHGSHFFVEGAGDAERHRRFEGNERPEVYTYLVEIDETFDMTWTPKEPGRWLYHCHRMPHMRLPVSLNPDDPPPDHDHADPESIGMGGMILGLTVLPAGDEVPKPAWKAERKLELTVAERKSDRRFYELRLRETGKPPQKEEVDPNNALVGPPIVLQQNQPVEIAVVNKLKESTAMHWHGMEIESYYDGVPGWGGIGEKKAPAIEPGQTFVARLKPPRAGTYIYHSHWHDDNQLTNGVDGALIVMPPGAKYDSETDKPFVFGTGPAQPFGAMLLVNGLPQPTQMRLKTGVKYRFRLINITSAFGVLRIALTRDGKPTEWRIVAKDAVDTPAARLKPQSADQIIAIGESYDVEYQAASPQEATLEVWNPNDMRKAVQSLIFENPSAE